MKHNSQLGENVSFGETLSEEDIKRGLIGRIVDPSAYEDVDNIAFSEGDKAEISDAYVAPSIGSYDVANKISNIVASIVVHGKTTSANTDKLADKIAKTKEIQSLCDVLIEALKEEQRSAIAKVLGISASELLPLEQISKHKE